MSAHAYNTLDIAKELISLSVPGSCTDVHWFGPLVGGECLVELWINGACAEAYMVAEPEVLQGILHNPYDGLFPW